MTVELTNCFCIRSAATVSETREQKVFSVKAILGQFIGLQFNLIRTSQINALMGGTGQFPQLGNSSLRGKGLGGAHNQSVTRA